MLVCPYCAYENEDGSLVCENCQRLLLQATHGTVSLGNSPNTEVTSIPHPRLDTLSPNTVALFIGDNQKPIIVTVKDRMILGRRREVYQPELIDLGPFEAYRFGLSRNHAALYFKDGVLYLQDIGSVNGTWVNDRRLLPYQSVEVEAGSTIRLANLVLYVFYKTYP